MLTCPLCGTAVTVDNTNKIYGWCICPQCSYTGFIVDLLSKTDKPEMPKEDYDSIKWLTNLRNNVGHMDSRHLCCYTELIEEVCTDRHEQLTEPPLVSLRSKDINNASNMLDCLSWRQKKPSTFSGMLLPLFHQENEIVGYNAVYLPNNRDIMYGKYHWITYLHKWYTTRPKAFLTYQPDAMEPGKTLLVTSDILSFAKLCYWYQNTDPKYQCVLLLGETAQSIKYLTDYYWEPERIIMLCNQADVDRTLLDHINRGCNLEPGRISVLDKSRSRCFVSPVRRETTRAGLDQFIREKFKDVN